MKFFNKLITLGDTEAELSTDVRFLNGSILIMTALLIPYNFFFYYFELYFEAIGLTIGGGVYMLALLLSKKGYHELAKYLFITNLSFFVFYFSCALPELDGVKAFNLLSIGMAFLLAKSRILPIYTLILVTVGFYISIEQNSINPLEMNESAQMLMRYSLFPSAFLVLFFIIGLFKNQITQNVQLLNDRNEELTKSKNILKQVNTELIRSQDELKVQTEELQQANEQLEDFAYIASHDLKTPIRGIHSYTEFLKEDYEKEMPEGAKEMIESISKLSQRMDSLVNEVLKYSRAHMSEIELESFNLADVVQSVQKAMDEQPDIQIDISYDKLPDVKADLVGMKVAFLNFVTNAFKYNESENRSVAFNFDPNTKELLITDNGIGISEEDKPKVFAFFRRIHDKDEYGGGTGAGLAIVKKILWRVGVSIDFESEVGKGTTFKLNLENILV